VVSLAEKKASDPSEAEIFAKATKHFEEEAALGNFDPLKVIASAQTIKILYDPKLGFVRYGSLTLDEYAKLKEYGDLSERSYRTLHVMLQKAFPELTYEQVRKMPFEYVTRLSSLLALRVNSFLQMPTSETT
jgi:hypothetical protein